MTIDLSEATFTNDFISFSLPNGSTLILNQINESMNYDDVTVNLDVINLQTVDTDNNYVSHSNVVGIADDTLSVTTNYAEYEGKVLTSANMKYCKIEIYE